MQINWTRKIALECLFGDGATEGVYCERKLAALKNLRVLFVCENNFIGIQLTQTRHEGQRNNKCRKIIRNRKIGKNKGKKAEDVIDTMKDITKAIRTDGARLYRTRNL